MKNIVLASMAIIFLIFIFFISLAREKTDLDKSHLTISCKGNLHFNIIRPDSTITLEGSVSLTTLGSKRLAFSFTGQLFTEAGRFTLNRMLMMNYLYHPANHALELTYLNNNVSNLDTTPDEVFNQAMMKSSVFILKLSQFSDNGLLVSDTTTPLFVCISQ